MPLLTLDEWAQQPDERAPETGPVLVPEVVVVIHPIDMNAHPTYQPGFRWAVMIGGRPPTDLDYCVQAGSESTETLASVIGEMCGAAATKALRLFGCPARYAVHRLGYDPIPAEADERPLAMWRDGREGE